jgi:hypothetical protein
MTPMLTDSLAYSFTLKLKAVYSSETSVHPAVSRHIAEDSVPPY